MLKYQRVVQTAGQGGVQHHCLRGVGVGKSCTSGEYELLLTNRLILQPLVEVEVYGVAQLTAASLKAAATRFSPIDSDLLLALKKL